jgi:signal peptidase I
MSSPKTDKPRHSRRRTALDYAVTAVVAIALALLAQAFLIKPYVIPTTSMATTLVPGQRVLVDRLSYHFRAVRRGDIVVFREPDLPPGKNVLIKRVVGLPGDTLELRDGLLYVNGERRVEPYLNVVAGRPVPTLPGDVGVEGDAPGWTLRGPYTVPAGQFFVMGDNRTDSGDSRFLGPIPRERLIGRAFFTYWPFGRLGTL